MSTSQKGFANIVLIVVTIILVGAVGYFVFVKKSEPIAEQPTPTTTQTKAPTPTPKDETSNWKTYNNVAYGFELKYPTSWNLKNNALSFSTKNGYTATFSVGSIAPTTKDFTIEEMRKEYDRTAGDNPRTPKASEVLKDIFIGNEAGLEWAGIACEQGNPCYARYEFYSNSTRRKGFKFYLTIPNLKDSDVNYFTFDPHPLFSDDITTIRKALSTLRFVRSDNNLITRSDWGISFAKPSSWIVTNNMVQQIELKQASGEWKEDRITVQYVSGERITDQDAKFGDITYWYNQSNGRWVRTGRMNEVTGVMEPSVVEATPKFYVAGNVPVFVGTRRWLTYIVPLSYSSFLKFNITGSGYSQPLIDLVKTINKL